MAINLVQYRPEIPHNTINIMLTCAGANIKLHLIKPLGFILNKESIERTGASHVNEVDYTIYESWDDFVQENKKGKFYFCTQNGQKSHNQIDFSNREVDHFIILGAESNGFPKELIEKNFDDCFRLPMVESVESLNVSSVGAVVAYEALRQQNFPKL